MANIDQVIFTSATPGDFEKQHSSQIVELVVRPTGIVDPAIEIRPVFDPKTGATQVDDLIQELQKVVEQKGRALVNTLTRKMAEDLAEFLTKKGFRCR